MKRQMIAAGVLLVTAMLAVPVLSASAQSAVTVPISPAPTFSVSGTATLTPQGNRTAVAIQVKGFPPNTVHPTHFHTGTCAQAGPPVIPLPDLSADATGAATANAVIDVPIAGVADGNHFFMTHVGPPPPVGPALVPMACGDVPLAAMAMPSGLPRSGDPGVVAGVLAAMGSLLAGAVLRRRSRS
jgi:hypothetical protein